jgi:hypothetical protein
MIELHNAHTNNVTLSLRDTQAQLEEIVRRTDTAVKLLYESEIAAPMLDGRQNQANRVQPIFTIMRQGRDGTTEIVAGENTPVAAGDSIKVEMPTPSAASAPIPLTAAPSEATSLARSSAPLAR